MRVRIVIGTAVLALAAPVIAATDPKDTKIGRAFLALTPDTVARAVVVKDDDLDLTATLSTIDVFQEKRGLLGLVPWDSYLRAFIDKRTGATSYQVYVFAHYYGERADWQQVNFETSAGLKTAPLTTLGHHFGGCRKYLGCDYADAIGFDVDEALLHDIAAAYRPGQMASWQFKLLGKSGSERRDGFAAAEVAGLLQAVAAYKTAHGLPRS